MSNANRKGKRGEREAVKLLRSFGIEARRSQQYQGVVEVEGSADVQSSLANVRIEVKRGYNDVKPSSKQVRGWIEKARSETREGSRWLILWRKDYGQWLVILETTTHELLSYGWFDRPIILFTYDVENVLRALNA